MPEKKVKCTFLFDSQNTKGYRSKGIKERWSKGLKFDEKSVEKVNLANEVLFKK